MMTVTSQLTNLTLAEPADGSLWDDLGGGQGSAQSGDLPIEGTESRSRRIDAAIRGFGFDAGAGQDISATGVHIGFWVNVLQPALIGATHGLQFSISDSGTGCQSGNWDGHNFTAGDYPATGGWQRVWLNPTGTRDAGSGTLALTGVRNYGCAFDMGNVGGNAPNCHLDRIDYTARGLSVTAGTVGTPTTFSDAVTEDATGAYGIIFNGGIHGPVEIGVSGGTSNTVFTDTNFAYSAGNQPLAATNWIRIDTFLENASDAISWGGWFLDGVGVTVTGTSGTFNMGTGTLLNGPAITLNSAVTFAGKFAVCGQITWGQAALNGVVFEESSASSALLCNEASDPDGELDGCSFSSDGTGHAIEFGSNTPTTITLRNIALFNYAGTDGSTGNEAYYFNIPSGVCTVNLVGGSGTPSIRTAGATINVVQNPVTTLVTVLDITGSPIENARVYLETGSGGLLLVGNVIISGLTNASGQISDSRMLASDQPILGRVRKSSTSPLYKTANIIGTIDSSNGVSLTAVMIPDE